MESHQDNKKPYWDHKAAIEINELSEFVPIKREVRQGCVFTPDLFSAYSQRALINAYDLSAVKINRQKSNNLWRTDDTALIAYSHARVEVISDRMVAK